MQWISIFHAQLQQLSWNALTLFGALLIFGLIGGQVVARISWIPRITGYLLIGFILGPDCLGWVSGDVFEVMHIFADVAIALIVYQLGSYVDLRWIVNEKWMVITVITSSLLGFLLVWQLLEWNGVAHATAVLAAIFAIGTSPAVIIAIMRDTKAQGQITRRLAVMTALNNVIALLAAYALLPFLAAKEIGSISDFVLHTIYSIVGSFLVAFIAYRLMMPLARWLGRRRQQQFVLVIAIMTLTLGTAHALKLPVLLTMLAFAIFCRNLDRRYDLMDLEFGVLSELFIVLLFVTFGATMQWPKAPLLAVSVALLILARSLTIGGSVFAFARPAKLSWRQATLLSMGCLPITESGLGLAQISIIYPHMTADLMPILAATLMVGEILGPFATQFALRRAGESGHT